MSRSDFAINVYKLIRTVPKGKVVSYSQVAMMCGSPGASRAVGQIAHFGNPDLPWHRLVYSSGKLANGYVPGGPKEQRVLLEKEGIKFRNDKVLMRDYQL
jgi:methylated-DNA-protein-cysteine methyltransferase-like protein